jgi:hypothetical protein
MKPKGKKFISLFLIFSLVMLSANLYAKERRGAKLIVTKKDGQQIRGELITVKPNSLLLMNTDGKDVSVGIADIKVIRIVKKSKVGLGAGIGFLIGAAVGTVAGSQLSEAWWWESGTEICAVIGGIAFGILGGLIVSSEGKDETIQIEGMTDLSVQEAMDKLRKKASIRDYK